MVELRNVLTQLPERTSELEPLSGREVPLLLHRNGLQIKEFRKGLVMMDLHLIDNADLDLLAEKCARS